MVMHDMTRATGPVGTLFGILMVVVGRWACMSQSFPSRPNRHQPAPHALEATATAFVLRVLVCMRAWLVCIAFKQNNLCQF